ncbi:serine--tRNA ligase, partial [Bifidobacterium pseudocatenulatum]|nr:serine--tRNA ligase [Bifidobacterium pseudocatenulatum]
MLDVKMMRQNFDYVQEKLMTRGVKKETLAEFMELDENRRKLLVKSEELKKYRNDVSGEIAQLKRNKEDATAKINEMKEVGG